MFTIFTPISTPVLARRANHIHDDKYECSANAYVQDKSKPSTWLNTSLKIVKCGSSRDDMVTFCSHHEAVLKAHAPKDEEEELEDLPPISNEEYDAALAHQSKWRKILGGIVVGSAVLAGVKLISNLKAATNSIYEGDISKRSIEPESAVNESLTNSTSNFTAGESDFSMNSGANASHKNTLLYETNVTTNGNSSQHADRMGFTTESNTTSLNLTEKIYSSNNNFSEGVNTTEINNFVKYITKLNLTTEETLILNNLTHARKQEFMHDTFNLSSYEARSVIHLYNHNEYKSPEEYIIEGNKTYDSDDATDNIKRQIICFRKTKKDKPFNVKINWNFDNQTHTRELTCDKPILFEIPRNVTDITICHPIFRDLKDGCQSFNDPLFTIITDKAFFSEGAVAREMWAKWASTEQRYLECGAALIENQQWTNLKHFAEDILSETTLLKAPNLDRIVLEFKSLAESRLASENDLTSAAVGSALGLGAVALVGGAVAYGVHKKCTRPRVVFSSLQNLIEEEQGEEETSV